MIHLSIYLFDLADNITAPADKPIREAIAILERMQLRELQDNVVIEIPKGYWSFQFVRLQVRKTRSTSTFVFSSPNDPNKNFVIQPQTMHKSLGAIDDFCIVPPSMADLPEYKRKKAPNLVITEGLAPAKIKHLESFKSTAIKRAAIKKYMKAGMFCFLSF